MPTPSLAAPPIICCSCALSRTGTRAKRASVLGAVTFTLHLSNNVTQRCRRRRGACKEDVLFARSSGHQARKVHKLPEAELSRRDSVLLLCSCDNQTSFKSEPMRARRGSRASAGIMKRQACRPAEIPELAERPSFFSLPFLEMYNWIRSEMKKLLASRATDGEEITEGLFRSLCVVEAQQTIITTP